MTMNKIKMIPLFATMALSARAFGDTPPDNARTHQLDVEVHDRDRMKRESTAHLGLFVREGNTAAVETRLGDDNYKLRVSPHGGWIEISLERRSRPSAGVSDLLIQTVREVGSGTKAVLAEIDTPDGGRTEVTLTVK